MISPTYLAGALIAFTIWLFMFLLRKDLRVHMIVISLLTGIFGTLMEYFYWTVDWWSPVTITHTRIGFEDLIFCFAFGGVSIFLFEVVSRNKFIRINSGEKTKTVFLIFLIVSTGLIAYHLLRLHSFTTWILSTMLPVMIVWYLRKDVVIQSLVNALLLVSVVISGFFLLNLMEPNFIYEWWKFERLSGHIVLGVPAEDLTWFFAATIFVRSFYLFWRGLGSESQ